MSSYKPIDMHKNKSDVLIIHCADPRFQAAYRNVIDDLGVYFDILVAPGASKAIVDNPSFANYIKLLHGLHNFETVHILDHIECGAFGLVDDEINEHSKMLVAATKKINELTPELKVVPHLLGEKRQLTVEV